MMSAVNKYWGPKPKLIRWIYTSIIRPRITYSAMTWGHSAQSYTKTRQLKQINRLASLMMSPTRKTTPTTALEIINDLMPLNLYITKISLAAYSRIAPKLDWRGQSLKNKTQVGHIKHLEIIYEAATQNHIDVDTTYYQKPPLEQNYIININPLLGTKPPKLTQINVYTDGSKTKDGTGAGFVIQIGKDKLMHTESINLPQETSIFHAEIKAIEQAAKFLINNHQHKQKYIKIFCDSQAALKALRAPIIYSLTVLQCHNRLIDLANLTRKLTLTWIKAHVGHPGNELADEYAKIGTIDTSNWQHINKTKTNISNLIEDYMYKKWLIAWEKQPGCRQTKYFYPSPSKIMYKRTCKLARSQLTLIIQIITGQNKLNYLSHKINPHISELCRFCEEEDETFIHLLSECPVFTDLRIEVFKCRAFISLEEWKPHQLLKFAQHPQIYAALTSDVEY